MPGAVSFCGFPSFHTVLALISTWGAWRVRYLGSAVAVLNVLVIIAIPGDGGHFLIDIAGGVGVTMFAIAVASVMTRPGPVGLRTSVPSTISPAGS